MAITLLYGCCQVETCVADLHAARSCMREALGAVPVEQDLARQIAALMPNSGYAVDHLECGGAVFQLNQPARGMEFNGQKSIHQSYLDRNGPCVTNLNYYVDDIGHARALLESMGAAVHIEGPSNVAPALGEYGPDNTRPGCGERPFLFMGTRHLIGFDLEIMEPNFLRVRDQSTQFPAFLEPRPGPAGDLRLHRLVALVPDIEATWEAIRAIFAPASRSKPYAITRDEAGCSFRIGLGGMEIEYRTPASGPLAEQVTRDGAGVQTIVFGCANSADRGELDSGRMQLRTLIGFDVLLEGPEPVPGG